MTEEQKAKAKKMALGLIAGLVVVGVIGGVLEALGKL